MLPIKLVWWVGFYFESQIVTIIKMELSDKQSDCHSSEKRLKLICTFTNSPLINSLFCTLRHLELASDQRKKQYTVFTVVVCVYMHTCKKLVQCSPAV